MNIAFATEVLVSFCQAAIGALKSPLSLFSDIPIEGPIALNGSIPRSGVLGLLGSLQCFSLACFAICVFAGSCLVSG